MIHILGLMCCRNRKEKTNNTICQLIQGNKAIAFDFIIVDDGSTDGTVEMLKNYANITLILGDGSLYYSGGMRIAIEEAHKVENNYDYILLFNDDVQFFDNSIEKMIHRDEVIWVGSTCDNQGKLTYGGVKKNSNIQPKIEIVMADDSLGRECDTFNANCVLIPIKCFKKLGNIDPVYVHSMGDFDYGFSAIRRGMKIKVTDYFVGICCDNPVKGTWRDTKLSRTERFKLKESEKGLPFKEWFHYLKKNYCLITAIVYSLTPYIKIIMRK